MGNVKKAYTLADAIAAIDGSNGQPLANGVGDPKKRTTYNATGKKLGHEYMHRGSIQKYEDQGDHPTGFKKLAPLQQNQLGKSRTENRDTSYRLAHYLLNTQEVQKELGNLDNNIGDPQKWLKSVPVTIDTLYGYEVNGTIPKKITKAAINFRKISDKLFIASVYPVEFQGERELELNLLFGS